MHVDGELNDTISTVQKIQPGLNFYFWVKAYSKCAGFLYILIVDSLLINFGPKLEFYVHISQTEHQKIKFLWLQKFFLKIFAL